MCVWERVCGGSRFPLGVFHVRLWTVSRLFGDHIVMFLLLKNERCVSGGYVFFVTIKASLMVEIFHASATEVS